MPKYKIWGVEKEVEISSLKEFELAYAGAKIFYKVRPEKEKVVSTD